MTQRLFLSAVTEDYKDLRDNRLPEQLRRAGIHVVHQKEFVETGSNTLVKLAEFIERESDIVLQWFGSNAGHVPPKDVTNELLRHCGADALQQRFSELFQDDAFRRVTYSQWEAWLGGFYDKRVLLFQTEAAAAEISRDGDTPMSLAEHFQRLKPFFGYPTKFTDDNNLLDNAKTILLRLLNHDTSLKLTYDSNQDPELSASWITFSPDGDPDRRITFGKSESGRGGNCRLRAFGKERVGIVKSFSTVEGEFKFSYKVEHSISRWPNIFFYAIPMQEPSYDGLIEVGANIQDHPDNEFSALRIRFTVPPAHYGDGEWHSASIEFHFKDIPETFYTCFAPRINEGASHRGSGTVVVSNIQLFAP